MTADKLTAAVRAAVQAILDAENDGYLVSQFVIAMGLERFNSDGVIESTPWLWAPPEQAEWMTVGLLDSAIDIQTAADVEDT